MGKICYGLLKIAWNSVLFILFRQMLINGARVDGGTDMTAAQLTTLVKSLI